MNPHRPRLFSFVLESIAIIAAVFAVGTLVEQTWLEERGAEQRYSVFFLARGIITSVLVMALAALVIHRRLSAAYAERRHFRAEQSLRLTAEHARRVHKADVQRERLRAEEALRISAERFRVLVENSSDGIALLAADGAFLYSAPSVSRLLGLSPEELLGRSAFDLVHPDDLPLAKLHFRESVWKPSVSITTVCRWRHQDGSWRYMEAIANNRLNDPAVGGIVVNFRDISERRRLDEQLRQAQKMEAVGNLAGGVAHDFNNLLTAILGYTELLRNSLARDDPLHRYAEEIAQAGERAATLTRQLLAFSRKQVTVPSILGLNEVVANLERMLRRVIGEDIQVQTLLAPELGRIKADSGQLEQVLLNLAVNARDAMPHGGRLTIQTANVELKFPSSGVPAGRQVLLSVSDTGVGMSEEIQSRIFEPFFTTKEQGKGTGLGLSTVYGIVEQSGGHIRVSSEPGHGSTFNIYLPRVDEPPVAAALSDTAHDVIREPDTVLLSAAGFLNMEESPPSPARRSEVVLLVEDQDMVRALLRRILVNDGYTVLEAPHGDEALRLCQEHPGRIDLLVTDIVMPQMDGRRLAEQLTAHRPELRVLFISGHPDPPGRTSRSFEDEAQLLSKPFASAVFLDKVRGVLNVQDRSSTRRGTTTSSKEETQSS